MDIKIYRREGQARQGPVQAPPSKSVAHRLLICAALADGISRIDGLPDSDDILATMDCLRALGAGIDGNTVTGMDAAPRGESLQGGTGTEEIVLSCRESGSTLRFLIPLCALDGRQRYRLSCSGRLPERPLTVYEEIFSENGLQLTRNKEDGSVTVCGRLKSGTYVMDGSVSSQFVSGLLFALPLLDGDSCIRLVPPVGSRPYIDMTLQALGIFGVKAGWTDNETIMVPGGQRYKAADASVEGDWSGASFLLALGAEVSGLDRCSLQGDRICEEYFAALKSGSPVLDISACPDLGPVLMAYAAAHNGCTLTGTRRLSLKESDRGLAMQQELAKFGVSAEVQDDSIDTGCGVSAPAETLDGHNDHRIVMALAVLCADTGGVIRGAEAVNKSFPDFFEKLAELGINCEEQTGRAV